MKVNITEEYIKNGKPGSTCDCPVALAFKDLGCDNVQVEEEWAAFHFDGEDYCIDLPEVATKFIINFDYEDPEFHAVSPFSFEVSL